MRYTTTFKMSKKAHVEFVDNSISDLVDKLSLIPEEEIRRIYKIPFADLNNKDRNLLMKFETIKADLKHYQNVRNYMQVLGQVTAEIK